MFTFDQLLNAATQSNNRIRVLVSDTAAQSIVNVLKRQYKTKITIEQAFELQRAAGVEPF